MEPQEKFEKNLHTSKNRKKNPDKVAKFWNCLENYLGELQKYEKRQQEKLGENWKEEWKLTTPGIHTASDRSKAVLWAELGAASKQAQRPWQEKFFSGTDVYPPEWHNDVISKPKRLKKCTEEEIDQAWEEDEDQQKKKIAEYVDNLFGRKPTDPAVINAKEEKYKQLLEDARVRREQEREKRSKRRLDWIAYHILRRGHHAKAADIRKAKKYKANWTSFAKKLEKKSAFDSWDLSHIDDELQLFMGCVFAAHEEAVGLGAEMKSRGINQRLEPIPVENIFNKDGSLYPARMQCIPDYAVRYIDDYMLVRYYTQYNSLYFPPQRLKDERMEQCTEDGSFSLGEGVGNRLRNLFDNKRKLPLFISGYLRNVLHENGHKFSYNMLDKGRGRLTPDAKKIVDDVSETIGFKAPLLFYRFVEIKLKEYLLTEANKQAKTGEFVTDGVFYEPGKEQFSLSEYAKTNPGEFIAELYAKVMTTQPGAYLDPSGRVMRKLINNNGSKFIKWLDEEIRRENGQYYKKSAKYLANHLNGDGSLTFEKDVDGAYWAILRKFGYQGKQGKEGGTSSFGAFLMSRIKERMKKNYFDADTQETADAAQKKLAHTLNILDALPRERLNHWLNQLKELQQMGRYQHGKDGFPAVKVFRKLLDILVEKYHDTPYTDDASLERLLETEIAIVERDLAAAQEAKKRANRKTSTLNPDSCETIKITIDKNRNMMRSKEQMSKANPIGIQISPPSLKVV